LAKLVVKNGKKALAIEKDITKNGLPSGWNDESLDTWILDAMFDRLKGNREALDEEDVTLVDCHGDVDTQLTKKTRPADWTFVGWMAYRLFGPRAKAGYESVLWELEEGRCKSDGGRAALRSKDDDAMVGRIVRSQESSSLSEKDAVMIAQVESRSTLKQLELDVVLLETMVSSNSKEIEQIIEMIRLKIFTSEEEIEYKERIKTLLDENRKLKEEMGKSLHKVTSSHPIVSKVLKKSFIDLTNDDDNKLLRKL